MEPKPQRDNFLQGPDWYRRLHRICRYFDAILSLVLRKQLLLFALITKQHLDWK
jgi:hypothetical protein